MPYEITEPIAPPAKASPKPLPLALAAAGSILLLAATFAPWYRVGPGHVSHSAWQESPVVITLLLAVVVVGGVLAGAAARGRTLAKRTLTAVFTLTMATTLVVVFRLFIERPDGNSATLAFGGYPALLAINLVKTGAVVSLARRRRPLAAQVNENRTHPPMVVGARR